MALFAATISHALTAAHNRLRAGEFIAVLTAATVLVVAGAAYEFSRERTRLRAAEDRMKRRDQAKADECRRCHEARLAESNRSARL
jgi:cytochrome c553